MRLLYVEPWDFSLVSKCFQFNSNAFFRKKPLPSRHELQKHSSRFLADGHIDVRHGLHLRVQKTAIQRQYFRQAHRLLSGYDNNSDIIVIIIHGIRSTVPHSEIRRNKLGEKKTKQNNSIIRTTMVSSLVIFKIIVTNTATVITAIIMTFCSIRWCYHDDCKLEIFHT